MADRKVPISRLRIISIILFCVATGGVSAQTVTRGPYLQNATSTSMVVRWRTDTNADSRVLFGPSPTDLSGEVIDPAATTEHEIQLTGLTADTTYYYAIGTSTEVLAGADADHRFDTAPVPGSERPVRVWAIGDSGTKDINAEAVRDAYLAFNGTAYTQVWLMLGDNAYQNGTDTDYQAAVFDMYPGLLKQTSLWPTLGNHDGRNANSSNQSGVYYDIFTLPKNGEAGGLLSGTEAYYSFDYANIHFICLDSFETDRFAGSAMMTWLENDLAVTTQKWIVAFWHHPPYSKGSHDSDAEVALLEMRENALPILEAYGVDLVLSGHSHSYERSFQIDGHYGTSATLQPTMILDGGSGREDGDGAYMKQDAGTVYVVAGNAGHVSGGDLNHPVMYLSLNQLGSVVLDFNGDRLDAKFISDLGAIEDYLTIVKVPPGNQPPTVDAGPDQSVVEPASVALDGTVSDDGLPNPPATVGTTWSLVSGPGPVTFAESQAVDTIASGLVAGIYVFRLTADDSEFTGADEVTVTVFPPGTVNQPPSVTASATPNPNISLGATLSGIVVDDGLPAPPGAVSTGWTQLSGPGTAAFSDASSVDSTVSFSVAGTYGLRLTADDGEFSSFSDLTVTVEMFEAETLQLTGGNAASTNCICTSPSGGQCARNQTSVGNPATATMPQHTGPDGLYQVSVTYCDESDDGGAPDSYTLNLDGALQANWLSSDGAGNGQRWQTESTAVSLTAGNVLSVVSIRGSTASWARIDKIGLFSAELLNAPPSASDVSIVDVNGGAVQVGDALDGVYTYADAENDPEGVSTFRWLRNGSEIAGETALGYTVAAADAGSILTLEVTPVATGGASPGAPVTSTGVTVNAAPTATGVFISDTDGGALEVGDGLTGIYTYSDADGDLEGVSTFRWLRDGVEIAGATTTGYTAGAADAGSTLTFEITPVAASGTSPGAPAMSSGVTVNAAPTASGVSITDSNGGALEVGDALTGVYTYGDSDGDSEGISTFRWLKDGSEIAGATTTSYTPVAVDAGSTLTFEVTPVASNGTSPGAPATSPGVFVNNAAPTVDGVSIIDGNGGSVNVDDTLTGSYSYSDAESDPEGVSTFRWLRDGTTVVGTTIGYTATTADAGASLAFEVTPVAISGTSPGIPMTSSAVTVNAPPTASNVIISDSNGGVVEIGDTLLGSYTYQDADGDLQGVSTFRWLRDGATVVGTAANYITTAADAGTSLTFEVTPVAASGTSPGAAVMSPGVIVNNAAPTATNVLITDANGGLVEVGDVLNGTYSYNDSDGDVEGVSTFRWLRNGTEIADATAIAYTTVAADGGSVLTFEVTPVAQTGTSPGLAITSPGVNVQMPNAAPTATAVLIVDGNGGIVAVGDVLSGTYVYNDTENDLEGISIYRWLRNGATVVGTTRDYTTVQADVGAALVFEVTPVAQTGTSPGGAVTSPGVTVAAPNVPPAASAVSIIDGNGGFVEVGDTLTGTYSYNDADGDLEGVSTFRWLRDANTTVGTAVDYTAAAADAGSALSFEVTPVAQTGVSPGTTVTSLPVAVIVPPILFEAEDMTLTGGNVASTDCICASPSAGRCARNETSVGNPATASATHSGASGVYQVDITYCDEDDDGGATDNWAFSVNGVEQFSWSSSDGPGSGQGWRTESQTLTLEQGNVLSVTSIRGSTASWARLDKVELFPSSSDCGNGGIDPGEVCELGDSQACVDGSGYAGSQQCNALCSGFAECVATEFCGDGVVQVAAGETCDDGALNGTLGFCNNQCNGITVPLPSAVEAEDMTLAGGYNASSSCACSSPSGGLCARNQASRGDPASATTEFDGVDGTYRIDVTYCDEDDDGDGPDSYILNVGGVPVATWLSSEGSGQGEVWQVESVTLPLQQGNEVSLVSTRGGRRSWARFDKIEFFPVEP